MKRRLSLSSACRTSWPAIVQRYADFGSYTKAGDDGSKSESMTVERKITSRHGVDSRPLSEWLRAPGALPGGLCEDLSSSTLGGREEVLPWLFCRPRGVTASGFPSATRAARRSVSIPRRWKTTAPVAHRGSLPSTLTE